MKQKQKQKLYEKRNFFTRLPQQRNKNSLQQLNCETKVRCSGLHYLDYLRASISIRVRVN